MKHFFQAALLAGSILAGAAQAQDAKKIEAAPAQPAAEATPAQADKPAPGPGQTPDPKIFEDIIGCLGAGLTPDWKRAWFVIRETDRNQAEGTRQFEGDFYFATSEKDRKGRRLQTCGPELVIQRVSDLNDYLTMDQQRWTSAVFTFTRDGKYDVKYDYTPFKPKAAAKASGAKPAAKPAARKSAEAAK